MVGAAHIVDIALGNGLPKHGVTRLVNDSDFRLGHMQILHQVPLGLLADGHHHIGYTARMALFDAMHHAVERFVELRVAPHNQIVHGDHTLDGTGYAVGQLVAETVEQLHLVLAQMHRHSETPPDVGEKAVDTGRSAGRDVGVAREILGIFA